MKKLSLLAVLLAGVARAQTLELTATPHVLYPNFVVGTVTLPGYAPIEFANYTATNYTGVQVTIVGPDAGNFQIDSVFGSLNSGESLYVSVRPLPTTVGKKTASIRITAAEGVYEGPVLEMTVLEAPPVPIESVLATPATTYVRLTWHTPIPSNSGAIYLNVVSGESGAIPAVYDLVTDHSVFLEGLQPETTYRIWVRSWAPGYTMGFSAPVEVTTLPVPVISLDFSPVDFGSVPIGVTSGPKPMVFTNNSNIAVTCNQATLIGPDPEEFLVVSDNCQNIPVNPGASCSFNVTTTPRSTGLKTSGIRMLCSRQGIIDSSTSVLKVTGAVAPGEVPFTYTGADQYFTVPQGVTWLHFLLWGAGGEWGTADLGGLDCEYQPGGGGGFVAVSFLPVTPGEVITIRVGGAPKNDTDAGWPNGGKGWLDAVRMGRRTYVFGVYGGGGGSTQILRSNTIIAEAGGGNGGLPCAAPLGGGVRRSCTPFGNQRGTDFAGYYEAGGGGWCGGGNNIPSASGAITSYGTGWGGWTAQPANGQTPGAANDAKRSDAGQGGFLYPATNGRVHISWW